MTDSILKLPQFLLLLLIFLFSSANSNAQSIKTNADSGWVQITTNLDEFYVVINEDFYNPVLLKNNESIQLAAGTNQLRLVWNTINDWQTQVTVIPGDTVNTGISFSFRNQNLMRSSYTTLLNQVNTKLRGTPESLFRINGKLLSANYTDTLLAPGLYKMEIGNGRNWQSRDVMITAGTFIEFSYEIAEIYPKSNSFYFIPGAGYWYHRKKVKSILTVSALALISGPLIDEMATFGDAKSSFEKWESQYNETLNTQDAIRFRENADAQRESMIEARKQALWYGAGLALIYGFSVWDSMNIGTTRYYRTKVTTSLVSSGFENTLYPTLVLTHDF